jgi:pentatricopeptide repeat protein
LKTGLGYNVVVGTSLVDMYSKCGDVDDSRLVFDHMVNRNVITWTSMVTGYSQIEKPDEAMALVKEMVLQDLRPNCVTYNSLLSSFSGPDCLSYCLQVHCCIIQLGLESNVYIAATLVTVYSKCSSSLEDFKKVCSVVMTCDNIAWNAVIAGYSKLGRHEEALRCFHEMKQAGIDIDSYTLTSVVGAIGNSSFLEEGKAMHALIHRTGYISHLNVQNGLVSMYARCGAIGDSKRVFWFMEEHDVISWNALLTAFAHHGYGREAVELFEQMRKTEIKPNSSTFLAVLCACSHVGFVDKGIEYFDTMKSDILLEPLKVEHYASLVDTFGRAGYLNEAEAFINSMPIVPAPSVYKALLSASLVHGNREIAARSAKKLLELWPNDPATYVLLSSVLTVDGNWDDAADLRKLMCDRGLRKKPGYSWT